MQKNVASQKLIVFAFDSTTNLPKSGDAANITAYVSKDYGTVTVLGDTSATEMDATNAKGYYLFDLTQAETNADTLLFSAKSVTANIVVIGVPATVFTTAPNFNATAITSGGIVQGDLQTIKTQTVACAGGVTIPAATLASTTNITAGTITTVTTLTGLQVKKNTALAAFEFVMFDSSGNPKTGLTVTATRSLDGAAFGACANAVAEVANGVYKISLAAADLNANTVMLQFAAASQRTTFVFLTPQP